MYRNFIIVGLLVVVHNNKFIKFLVSMILMKINPAQITGELSHKLESVKPIALK